MLGFGLGLNKWRRVGGGFVGLLDLYPNAAFAPSIRLLRKNYSGGLVRARAWDGLANQGEADVMAYRVSSTEYLIDLNSTLENLDATAIGRGLTTSDTLADLVSTGASDYDGLVSAWYDQSLSNNATQSTAAAQPKIVSGGSLVVMGGASKAAIEGSISSLSLTTALTPTDFSIIHTSEGSGFVANIGEYIRISDYYRYNIDGNNYISSDSDSSQPSIYIGNRNGTTLNLRRNGSEMDSSPHTSVATALNITTIFNRSTLYFVGKISEFIIFESNQSSNFSGIETNLNTFYSIYP